MRGKFDKIYIKAFENGGDSGEKKLFEKRSFSPKNHILFIKLLQNRGCGI